MAPNPRPKLFVPFFMLLLLLLSFGCSNAELEQKLKLEEINGRKGGGSSRVSVSTVALSTLAMAAATGLGALPFFFLQLGPQWAGLCNGMAAGVMLAASFDLIQEGQYYGAGNWVVIGILAGGIFIWLCKKVVTCCFYSQTLLSLNTCYGEFVKNFDFLFYSLVYASLLRNALRVPDVLVVNVALLKNNING